MHKWTEELWQISTKEKFDRVLRDRLGEKAKEIDRLIDDRATCRDILGISPFSEVGEPLPKNAWCSKRNCQHDPEYDKTCDCECHLPKPKDTCSCLTVGLVECSACYPKPKDSSGCGCELLIGDGQYYKKYCLKHEPKQTLAKPKDSEVCKTYPEKMNCSNCGNQFVEQFLFGEPCDGAFDCPMCGCRRARACGLSVLIVDKQHFSQEKV